MKCLMKDFDKVYHLLTSSDLAGDIFDDNVTDVFAITKYILGCPAIHFLMPSDGTAFRASSNNSILWDVHLITTNQDKQDVYKNTLLATQWMKDNTTAEFFMAYIPEQFESTLYYSNKIGMEKLGMIPNAYLKDGDRHNVFVVGCPVDEIIRRLSWQQR